MLHRELFNPENFVTIDPRHDSIPFDFRIVEDSVQLAAENELLFAPGVGSDFLFVSKSGRYGVHFWGEAAFKTAAAEHGREDGRENGAFSGKFWGDERLRLLEEEGSHIHETDGVQQG